MDLHPIASRFLAAAVAMVEPEVISILLVAHVPADKVAAAGAALIQLAAILQQRLLVLLLVVVARQILIHPTD